MEKTIITNPQNIFQKIKSKLNILKVAKYYGIKITNKNKAICPFHDDHHPSLCFKNNRFKCFACGISGSVIDFVSNMFDLSILDATKKLNEDFNLGILKPLNKYEIQKLTKRRENEEKINNIIKSFETWQEDSEQWFLKIFKLFRDIQKSLAPKNFQQPSKIWFLVSNHIEHIEPILELFASNDREQILDGYSNIKNYKFKLIELLEEL